MREIQKKEREEKINKTLVKQHITKFVSLAGKPKRPSDALDQTAVTVVGSCWVSISMNKHVSVSNPRGSAIP